jgi:hypothetical protein
VRPRGWPQRAARVNMYRRMVARVGRRLSIVSLRQASIEAERHMAFQSLPFSTYATLEPLNTLATCSNSSLTGRLVEYRLKMSDRED